MAAHTARMNALWGILLLAGCTGQPSDTAAVEPAALATADGWLLLDPGEDPIPDRSPAAGPCERLGYGAEGTAFEVQTGDCPHGVFSQPAGHAAPAGSTVTASAWHMDLFAEQDAHGHLALQLGTDRAEIRPAIPGPPGAYTLRVTLNMPLEAGDPIVLHVHNHGSNSWYLGPVAVLPPEEL